MIEWCLCRSADVSKVTKKFEKRLENKILHPHKSRESTQELDEEEILSDDQSINSAEEPLTKKKEKTDRGPSLYGAGLPSLGDRSAEASQNTKNFAKNFV